MVEKEKMEKQQYVYKAPNHAANLNGMRLKDKWCDVTINVDGKEFRAHKVILAANLQYFDTMLSSDSFQESKDGVVNMESIRAADLEFFISYAYTGEITLTENNALNLLELANYLAEDGIKQACIQFLEKHLKVEDALQAYRVSKATEILSLKNVAKMRILSNFANCSQSTDYFDFDCESLAEILSDVIDQPVKMQQTFFEGIMRWIMHNANDRKIHISDLLSLINFSKLTHNNYLLNYLGNIAYLSDEQNIIKEIMLIYHTNKIKQKKQEKVLMVVEDTDGVFNYQFYNFTEKKWSLLQSISDFDENITSNGAILNNKLYFISEKSQIVSLQQFNPETNKITKLHLSSNISSWGTLSACSRFLYLCGGTYNLVSDQVMKYDPLTNSSDTLAPLQRKRHYAASSFYQNCLYVVAGHDGSYTIDLVEKYNPDTKQWSPIPSMNEERDEHAVAVLDQKLYACGGAYDINTAEVYDPIVKSWQVIQSMKKCRKNFLVIAYDGKLLAIGGDQENTVEVYDPSKNQWQIDSEMSSGLEISHPRGGFIPASYTTDV